MPIARKATVFWETTDRETVRLYQGDVLETLQRLPSGSVQMIVTSPPYWGLRSYLDSEHEHKGFELGSEKSPDCLGWARGVNCAEENWEEGCHVCRMVLVFREARRVLRDDGTLWLNYGDSYSSGEKNGNNSSTLERELKNSVRDDKSGKYAHPSSWDGGGRRNKSQARASLPSGNLVGVPWRVALALQADGWILRQDIIWAKPSPMPESVKNRCTKAHEYVFLFAKKGGYFCDMEAVKEGAEYGYGPTTKGNFNGRKSTGEHNSRTNKPGEGGTRNKRSVWKIDEEEFAQFLEWKAMNSENKLDWWNIASESYPGAHFATFPSKLITPMIKAGTSEKGCCSECGAPWKRVIEENKLTRERPNQYTKRKPGDVGIGSIMPNDCAGVETRTVGWEPSCECEGEVVPCIVLDPFAGSGTTNAVCITLGRNSIGIELSKDYLVKNAIPRIEGELLARPSLSYLVPRSVRKSTMVGEDITG